MSISVMKQALDAITNVLAGGDFDNPYADLKQAGSALREAIEFEEMVKKGTKAWAGTPDDWVDELRGGAEKREWVGLTDEDITQFRREGLHSISDQDFRAIEAKLKEKNA